MSDELELKDCPFCGDQPTLPDGYGTQYEMECECGMASSRIQISDLMSIEERTNDNFTDYRYKDEYIKRAEAAAIKNWNTRAKD